MLLALQLFGPIGVPIGGVHWRPAYGSVILESVGLQIIWFGLLAKIYFTAVGLNPSDAVVRWFERSFSLERVLVVSLGVVALGMIIEAAIALGQFGLLGRMLERLPDLGPLGASALVVGVQSAFSAFMAYLLTSEYARPALPPPALQSEGPDHGSRTS
jgi:hypothetical protein